MTSLVGGIVGHGDYGHAAAGGSGWTSYPGSRNQAQNNGMNPRLAAVGVAAALLGATVLDSAFARSGSGHGRSGGSSGSPSGIDRKSTRLNSSHTVISYAV